MCLVAQRHVTDATKGNPHKWCEEMEEHMPGIVVMGTQWGDEGKGKATDLMSERVDYLSLIHI